MPLGQKVVIVGGGHNGLIAAFYLAKGGFKPVVLERREIVGGGAVTEEFHPGFFVSALAHTLGPLRADVARDLAVEKFDCQILQPDPRVFSPSLDGKALLFYSDVAKTAGRTTRNSRRDWKKWRRFSRSCARLLRRRLINLRRKTCGTYLRPGAAFAGWGRKGSLIY